LLCALVVAAAAAVSCASGCDDRSVGGREPVELRFWNGFTGPDGRTMLAIVKRFNAANPDVHVTMQRMEWGTYYNKLFVARLGGRGPDVFVLHTDSIPRFQNAGFLRAMDDVVVAGDAKGGGLPAGDFDANVLEAVRFNGTPYAVPLDVHLVGMYYNRALFREAGVVDAQGNPKPPTNREEFLEACRKITRRTGNPDADRWGFVFTWLRTNVYTLFRQWGGDIFNADGTRCTINSPECVAALQFGTDLIHKEHFAPSPASFGAFIGFRQGKVGMVFEGIYMLPELQRQTDLDWAAAPVPTLGSRPATWCNSHNLCIRSDASGKELEASKRFVQYLSDQSLDWAEGGQVPVRKSLRGSDRFQAMAAQREFARQIPYATYMPRVLFVNEYLAEYEPAIEAALYGSVPPKQALDMAAANIERVMRRFGIDPQTGAQPGPVSSAALEASRRTGATPATRPVALSSGATPP
jgi:multiple sugar transport system substrate-binding protein